jgi:PAS domain S-box-containing protein
MRLRAGFLIAAVAASAARIAGAQEPALASEWRLTRYGALDRLPSDEIAQLSESADGRLWASTSQGFAWFDGWIWHPLADSGRTTRRSARYLRPGHGNSMIAIVHNLLYVGDTAGFMKLPVHLDNKEVLVESAVPIRQGLLALARHNADSQATLVLLRDGQQEPFPAPSRIGVGAIPSLFPAAGGKAWLNTDEGLWYHDGERWTNRLPARGTPFVVAWIVDNEHGGLMSIRAPDARAGLWTWNRDGVMSLNASEGDGTVISATIGREHALVAYRGGNVRVRTRGTWHLPPAESPSFVDARAVFFDSHGDLWVGSGSGIALFRLSSRLWTSHEHGFPSRRDRIHSLVSDRDGAVWAGTADGIDVRHASGSVRHIKSILGRPLGVVTGLARDSSGSIWVSSGASFPGAYRWDGASWRHFGDADGLEAERVHDISVDRAGRVWFMGLSPGGGPEGPGAFVLENGRFTRWGVPEGLPNGRVYAFAEGPDGTRWFGTRGGLSRWRNGQWTHWQQRRGTIGALTFRMPIRVFTLAVDRGGRPWFGSGDPADYSYGLGTVEENDSLRFFTTADGLLNNVVWQVLPDPDGTIWVTTEGGVSAWRDGIWFNFGTDRGLGHTGAWPLHLRDGILQIGTLGGGVRELRLDDARQPPPRVLIETSVVEGRHALVRWSAHAYRGTLPGNLIETRFRIDSGQWSAWSTARSASLNDLPVGRHMISIQAKGTFLPLEPVSARTVIRVQRPILLRPVVAGPILTLASALIFMAFIVIRRKREVQLERCAAQAALRASEEKFATAFTASPDPMCICSYPDGALVEVNRGFEAVTGHARAECVGRTWTDLGLFHDLMTRDQILRVVRDSERVRNVEFQLRRADGGRRVVSASAELVDLAGRQHLLWVMTDMTEKRSLEAQLAQAQKMEAVGQLAGGVAHDFNNLLTAILGHAELLRDSIEGATARSDVDEIHRAAVRAAELTGQLLTFARKQRVEPRIMSLNDLVHRTDKMLRRILGARIAVSTRCHHDVPAVRVDPGQIEQVLVNLAVNARDAMPDGGKLVIETDTVDLDDEYALDHPDVQPGRYAVLSVTDTGTGMPADVRSRIFEPFFTTKEVGKGTGLGLAICYGIVRQAGGHLAVDSEVGRGSTFRVFLPEVEGSAVAPAATTRTAMPSGTETVLLVEDEAPVRNLIRRVLTDAGYSVLAAADGEEAIDILEHAHREPDLLLTDVVLPGLTGPEIAREVRQRVPQVAVLYISGYTERAVGNTVFIDAPFLAKPFTPLAIAQQVRQVLDGVGSSAQH